MSNGLTYASIFWMPSAENKKFTGTLDNSAIRLLDCPAGVVGPLRPQSKQSRSPGGTMIQMRSTLGYAAAAAVFSLAAMAGAQTYATGDPRNPSEPQTPGTCETLNAQFTSSQVDVETPPTSDDTSRIQSALGSCEGSGKAVVLHSNGSDNAFLSGKLTLESDESLVI